jgi:hypothetical protein
MRDSKSSAVCCIAEFMTGSIPAAGLRRTCGIAAGSERHGCAMVLVAGSVRAGATGSSGGGTVAVIGAGGAGFGVGAAGRALGFCAPNPILDNKSSAATSKLSPVSPLSKKSGRRSRFFSFILLSAIVLPFSLFRFIITAG